MLLMVMPVSDNLMKIKIGPFVAHCIYVKFKLYDSLQWREIVIKFDVHLGKYLCQV